ncbi:hypothetical protein [Mesorhizobium sp.]|nr:hypothetical protein [Mesorhizobium sp.]
MIYRSSMDERRDHRLKPVELPVRSFVPAKGLVLLLADNGELPSLPAQ